LDLSLSTIPLDRITETDLNSLISNKVSEIKTLEYKAALPGNADGDKKEFLADTSSFANAAGGDVIYGMRETAGIASEICGLSSINADAEILRLESIVRDGVSPRIPSVATRVVPITGKAPVIIIRIPRSWIQPHMVKFAGNSRFYSRNSAGKYQLDVEEIRAAFALSETRAEQIRNFRRERLASIVAGETPVPLDENPPRFVIHSVPLTAFDAASHVNLSLERGNLIPLMPIGDSIQTYRRNFDGIVTSSGDRNSAYSYLQVFRNGSIEAVRSGYFAATEQKFIPLKYESEVMSALQRFSAFQCSLGVTPPLYLMLTLLDVRGYVVGGSGSSLGLDNYPIEKQSLILPEVELNDFEADLTKVMKPVFDMVWNASGWRGSASYDSDGNWKPR
jgi:hypothetical protein